MKKIRVFLSSRFGENNFLKLREELSKAIYKNLKFIGAEVVLLEKDNDPRSPFDASIEETRDSNLFIHILGETYGTPPEGEEKSYTHLEYEAAKENEITIVPIVIGDIYCSDPMQLSEDANFRKWQEDVLYSKSNIINIKFPTEYNVKSIIQQVMSDIGKIFNLTFRKNQVTNSKLYATVPSLIDQHEYIERHEIEEIKQSLLGDDKEIGLTSISKVGLHGMGGIGKTISAIALAHNPEIRRYFKDGIYFVTIGRSPNIIEKQAELLKDGFGIETANPSVANIREAFYNKKALLILDNVWEAKDIKAFDISNSNSKVLITSRYKDILKGKVHTIDVLSPEQALRLFKNIVGDISEDLEVITKEILDECGYLPLAVNIIGYTLRDRGIDTYNNILNRLKKSQLERIGVKVKFRVAISSYFPRKTQSFCAAYFCLHPYEP